MDGRQQDLETVFGPGGIWQQMLRDADGYLGTEVWCENGESRAYRVRDQWLWHRDFEKFRGQSQVELERFGNWIVSDGLIEKEQFLGAYYEKAGDDDSLVSS